MDSTGTLTFLMTDVEGSTHLWEADRDAMSLAMARHDETAAEVVESLGGSIVKARGEGDSLFIVFEDAALALDAACTIQRRFLNEPWKLPAPLSVRMALHTGVAEARAADYYGPTVNRCAKLRSIGHGGQILLTEASRAAVGERLPPGVRLRDMGSHLLRGISASEHVYQVDCALLPSEFPPLLSPDLTPTNLPYRRNPRLVARDGLVRDLHQALQDPRSPVALVGLTGIGKTQAAVEYAHRYLAEYPGGVYWLNAAGTVRLMEEMAGLGRLLNLPDGGSDRERAHRVRDALQHLPEPSLLVLDNLTDDVDFGLVPAVGCCRVLVTTVHRDLVRTGFRVITPPPLDATSAIALLRRDRSDLAPAEETAMRRIAEMLGGLPLALALVANHVERLGLSFREYYETLTASPLDTLARARRRFASDTGHSGSIYDALRISYDGLGEDARSVLRTASCFALRGISPELLFRASTFSSRIEFEEALGDLGDCFFMERDTSGRLSVHELVREFAATETPAEAGMEAASGAALALSAALGVAVESGDWGPVRGEVPHAVAAARACRKYGACEPLRALSMQLGEHAMQHGDPSGAAAWFREALAIAARVCGDASLETGRALRELSWACAETGDRAAACEQAQRALRIARWLLPTGDAELAEFENSLGYALKVSGMLAEALPHYQRALAIAGRSRGRRNRKFARYLNNIGVVLEAQGDLEGALDHLQEALRIDERMPGAASSTLAIRLNNVGRVLGRLGRWGEALECHRRAGALHEAAYGHKHPDVVASLCFTARAWRMLGQSDDARRLLVDARDTQCSIGDTSSTLGRMIQEEWDAMGLPSAEGSQEP